MAFPPLFSISESRAAKEIEYAFLKGIIRESKGRQYM
jgi:hypothetical protein